VSVDSPMRPALVRPPAVLARSTPPVEAAALHARSYLLGLQNADGHWRAQLEGDSILESEYVLTMYSLGRSSEAKVAKAGETLRRAQTAGGGWSSFPGGDDDVNSTVKAYFALKLLGEPADAPHMRAAARAARTLGGPEACNSFTKIYLAIFGQYPWARCPAVPPELLLLPSWVPFNVYEMSSWSRAIVVPLSIIRALRPHCPVPEAAGIGELVAAPQPARAGSLGGPLPRLFRGVDRVLRLYEKAPLRPLRRRAVERARRWTLEHLEQSQGLGAIFPPIVNSLFALRALGREDDAEVVAAQVKELERLELEEAETLKVQPCFSPVWDTALAITAALDAGVPPDDPCLAQAASWLVDHEVRRVGDWGRRSPEAEPGGWYFEYANEFYPDCDDTAQVVAGLARLRPRDRALAERLAGALDRGLAWLERMQNRDGGWGAFDKNCDREFLTHIPFADHNAMIDPSTVDVTARVVMAMRLAGRSPREPGVARGLAFIRRRQEPDGAWFGRWGCNYIYGTWLALSALRLGGESPRTEAIGRAVGWLEAHQNEDGGWGELPLSYSDPSARGCGPSTACQTGWALLGLMAGGAADGAAARRGVEYLLRQQEENGGWRDQHWTGTGFPEVFYLHYHLYATYFPLMALAACRRLAAGEDPFAIPAASGSAVRSGGGSKAG